MATGLWSIHLCDYARQCGTRIMENAPSVSSPTLIRWTFKPMYRLENFIFELTRDNLASHDAA